MQNTPVGMAEIKAVSTGLSSLREQIGYVYHRYDADISAQYLDEVSQRIRIYEMTLIQSMRRMELSYKKSAGQPEDKLSKAQ